MLVWTNIYSWLRFPNFCMYPFFSSYQYEVGLGSYVQYTFIIHVSASAQIIRQARPARELGCFVVDHLLQAQHIAISRTQHSKTRSACRFSEIVQSIADRIAETHHHDLFHGSLCCQRERMHRSLPGQKTYTTTSSSNYLAVREGRAFISNPLRHNTTTLLSVLSLAYG